MPTPTTQLEEIAAERAVFLAIDGEGPRFGPAFREAADLLATVAALLKREAATHALECRWRALDEAGAGKWSVMLRLSEDVSSAELRQARRALLEREGRDARGVRRVSWREGRALQLRHRGPHEDLADVYSELTARARDREYRIRGAGHEVYVTDPRETEPVSCETIVRLPVAWPRPEYAGGPDFRGSTSV